MFRTEFHIHTNASHDSLMSKRALLRSCKRANIDCVAITDHNEIKGALSFKPWLEARGVSVIVGEEIFSSEGEIIGLWLSDRIEPGLTPEETVAEIKQQDGAVYIPHPYDEKRYKTVLDRRALIRIADDVDCIEIHNGRNADNLYDDEQEMAYQEVSKVNPSIKPIIGCDAHCFFEVGRNYVMTEMPILRDCFPECLSMAKFEFSSCHRLAHSATRVARAVKMIKGGDFNGIARVLSRKLSR